MIGISTSPTIDPRRFTTPSDVILPYSLSTDTDKNRYPVAALRIQITYQTIPYAPWPSSLVTLYRSSTIKSWLKTLKTFRPCRSDMTQSDSVFLVLKRPAYDRREKSGRGIDRRASYVAGMEFESQCFCANESEDEGGISMEQKPQLKLSNKFKEERDPMQLRQPW